MLFQSSILLFTTCLLLSDLNLSVKAQSMDSMDQSSSDNNITLFTSNMDAETPSAALGSIKKGGKSKLDDAVKMTTLQDSKYFEFDFKEGSVGTSGDGAAVVYVGPSADSGADDFGEEATLTYKVMFQEGFDFNQGGKLHGFFGGILGESCSGGDSSTKCFSSRIMWRADGAGEAYIYLPNNQDEAQYYCAQKPGKCTMGISLNRGSFTFIPGQEHTISMSIKLNTPGKRDGLLNINFDDNQVISHDDIKWRVSADIKISALFFNSFFGGSGQDWASSKDQSIFFRDFTITTPATSDSPPQSY